MGVARLMQVPVPRDIFAKSSLYTVGWEINGPS